MMEETPKPVQDKIRKLKTQIVNDEWMKDTAKVLQEEINNTPKIRGINVITLVNRFETGWEETAHFTETYFEPLLHTVKDHCPQLNNHDPHKYTHQLIKNHLWEKYHNYYSTYPKAKNLIEANS